MGPVYNNVLCTDTTCARPSNAYPKVVIGRRRRSAAARSKSSRRRALSFRTKKKNNMIVVRSVRVFFCVSLFWKVSTTFKLLTNLHKYYLVFLTKIYDYRRIAKTSRPLLYLELKNNSRKYAKNILCYLVKS